MAYMNGSKPSSEIFPQTTSCETENTLAAPDIEVRIYIYIYINVCIIIIPHTGILLNYNASCR